MNDPKTLQEAIVYFSSPDNCVAYLVERRWPAGVCCPTCGRSDVSYVAGRRVWQCKSRHAKARFSIKVGTIFEDSAIGLNKWLMAMWMIANCKNGVSSYEIHRAIGVTQKSAWFLLHRIRLAMKEEHTEKMGGKDAGPVEVDETWIGGKPKNMHRAKRNAMKMGEKWERKTIVMGMLDRDTRQVRAKVIPDVKRETLQAQILDNISHKTTVYTDGWSGYDELRYKSFIHKTVNHMEEYVRGQVHTQSIENFWALLKRGLNGTYVAVEPFHLESYVDEQAFRFNNRATKNNPLDDADRFAKVVTQIVGRRLTYNELTGKTESATQF